MKNSINTTKKKLTIIFTICALCASSLLLASNGGTKPKSAIPDFGKYENIHVTMSDFKIVNQNQNVIIIYTLTSELAKMVLTEKKAIKILTANGFKKNNSVLVVVKFQGKTLYKI